MLFLVYLEGRKTNKKVDKINGFILLMCALECSRARIQVSLSGSRCVSCLETGAFLLSPTRMGTDYGEDS